MLAVKDLLCDLTFTMKLSVCRKLVLKYITLESDGVMLVDVQ